MRTITLEVYKFDELSNEAKDKARDWYRQFVFSNSSDWDFVFEDAITVGKILGIEIDTSRGGTGPAIYFRGFSSQGDGACFEGSYKYAKGASVAIREYAPNDIQLHAIADGITNVQRRNFYELAAQTKHRGHYYHEYCMDVTVENANSVIDETHIADCLRDFARWIYKQLEAENDNQNSKEAVDEAIQCNEYEFYKNGTKM